MQVLSIISNLSEPLGHKFLELNVFFYFPLHSFIPNFTFLFRFAIFFPLKTPVCIKPGSHLEVHFWRCCGPTKVNLHVIDTDLWVLYFAKPKISKKLIKEI